MAIDTANKRKNSAHLSIRNLGIGLAPVAGISDDDRENGAVVYIGYAYAPPAAANGAVYSKIHVGMSLSF